MNSPRASATVAALVVIAIAIAAVVGAALGPVYGGRMTVGIVEMPARFDPAPAHGAGARFLSALVHERLVVLRNELPEPALAESWASAADGREWAIRLRPDSVFHDGAPITAADAARSLRRYLRSPSAAAAGWAARVDGGRAYRDRATDALPGLVVADALTLVVRVRDPSGSTLSLLAAADAAITSARGAGAGPFVPTTASPIRGTLAAVAFPAHVRGRPFLDAIAVQLAGSSGSGNGVDLAPAIGPGPLAATLLLILDPDHPSLARLEVRRAVDATIDREDLVRNFLPGGATILSPIPPLLLSAMPGAAPARPARSPRPASRSAAAQISMVLAVSSDVPALVSQRVVAYLGAAGLDATAIQVSPDNVWTLRAAARLVAWTPAIPEPLLAREELAWLAPSRGSEAVVLPLAALPIGHRSRMGLHGVAVDRGGHIRLEDAWIMP